MGKEHTGARLEYPDWEYMAKRLWYRIAKPVRRLNRALQRPRLIREQDRTGLLDWCQQEVARLDPRPNYGHYRQHERLTWEVVPGWLKTRSGQKVEQVLDVGCAYGTLALFARKLFGCRVCCLDKVDFMMSRTLRDTHGLEFAVCNIEVDPVPWKEKFDIIVFTEVLEHLSYHPKSTIQKLADALSVDGEIYITTPDPIEWGRITRFYPRVDAMPQPLPQPLVESGHVYHYTRRELHHLLGMAGLEVREESHCAGVSNRHLAMRVGKGKDGVSLSGSGRTSRP